MRAAPDCTAEAAIRASATRIPSRKGVVLDVQRRPVADVLRERENPPPADSDGPEQHPELVLVVNPLHEFHVADRGQFDGRTSSDCIQGRVPTAQKPYQYVGINQHPRALCAALEHGRPRRSGLRGPSTCRTRGNPCRDGIPLRARIDAHEFRPGLAAIGDRHRLSRSRYANTCPTRLLSAFAVISMCVSSGVISECTLESVGDEGEFSADAPGSRRRAASDWRSDEA